MNILSAIKIYIWNLLISIDQLINTIFGGSPDETISSRCGKRVRSHEIDCKFCKFLCIFLNWLDTGHCKDSIEEDEGDDALLK